MQRRTFITAALAAALGAASGVAVAQAAYPDRAVRIIVPFPAGGPADVLARIVGDKLAQSLGKPFIVDNKAGASGNIGMELGARAAPDGYTLTIAPVGNLTVAPALYPKLPYDPAKDFAPITVLADVPNVLVVHPSVPAKTVAELVAYAKSKPGALNYASASNGSIPHLAGELFKRVAGVDIVHVPFNGVAPAMNAVLAGDVQMFFAQSSSALPQWRAGKVVALGVATKKAHRRGAGAADDRRARIPGLRRDVVVRARGAGRHATGDRRSPARRGRARARDARRARQDRRPRRRAGRQYARRIRGVAARRGRPVDTPREGCEHPRRLTLRAACGEMRVRVELPAETRVRVRFTNGGRHIETSL